jgi:hypothetical protein
MKISYHKIFFCKKEECLIIEDSEDSWIKMKDLCDFLPTLTYGGFQCR